jgi:hypothetical protein
MCRECTEPLELDQQRMQRLGGRTFIECESCLNLIWIRRRDLRDAGPLAPGGRSVMGAVNPTKTGS